MYTPRPQAKGEAINLPMEVLAGLGNVSLLGVIGEDEDPVKILQQSTAQKCYDW